MAICYPVSAYNRRNKKCNKFAAANFLYLTSAAFAGYFSNYVSSTRSSLLAAMLSCFAMCFALMTIEALQGLAHTIVLFVIHVLIGGALGGMSVAKSQCVSSVSLFVDLFFVCAHRGGLQSTENDRSRAIALQAITISLGLGVGPREENAAAISTIRLDFSPYLQSFRAPFHN